MNERIKELAEQATSTLSMNHEGYRGKGYIEQVEYFDKEKFAELIVRECAKIADIADKNKCEWIGGNILTHFGVELDVNETLRNRSTYFGNDI